MSDTWEILKTNFHLAIRNNLFLAVVYLLIIPLLRGIANLDTVRSAECLEQSVILIGMFLIIPLNAPEQSRTIQEVVCTKKIPHWIILFLRLVMSMLLLIIMIGIFSGIMLRKNCTFPFILYVTGTVISAMALGSIGFLVSELSNSVVTGYLVSVGYFLLNFLDSVSNDSPFYLFSMGIGEFTAKLWLILLSILFMAISLIYEKKKKYC